MHSNKQSVIKLQEVSGRVSDVAELSSLNLLHEKGKKVVQSVAQQ